MHLGLRSLHLGLQTALIGERGIVSRLLARRSAEQGSSPIRRQFGILQHSLQLCHLCLLGHQVRFEGTALKTVEVISSPDFRAQEVRSPPAVLELESPSLSPRAMQIAIRF